MNGLKWIGGGKLVGRGGGWVKMDGGFDGLIGRGWWWWGGCGGGGGSGSGGGGGE